MKAVPSTKRLYRVRFIDQSEKKPIEVVVGMITPSEIIGLVVLEDFIFRDHTKHVILPEEEAARTKFGKTERLHIPYHSIIYMEEFYDQPTDLKNLPFIKEVTAVPPLPPS